MENSSWQKVCGSVKVSCFQVILLLSVWRQPSQLHTGTTQETSGTNWNTVKPKKTYFYCEGGWILRDCPEKLWCFHPWRYSRYDWICFNLLFSHCWTFFFFFFLSSLLVQLSYCCRTVNVGSTILEKILIF